MAHLQIQQGQWEIYSLGAKWGSVDGWKVTKARGILARLTQQDPCWRQVRERRYGYVCVFVCVYVFVCCVCVEADLISKIPETEIWMCVCVCVCVCCVCVETDLISKIPEEESLNWLSRILARIELSRPRRDPQGQSLVEKRIQRILTQIWSRKESLSSDIWQNFSDPILLLCR